MSNEPVCLLTFDVEEHFQIEAARPYIAPGNWAQHASRLQANVEWLLGQLGENRARATFFTLGWVARKHPAIIRRIVDAGHELACHGDAHDRLHRLTPGSFAEDLRRARASLEDVGGVRVNGYRAPTFSLTRQTAWAVDVLADAGFIYDSSVQPIRHPQYGQADAPRWAYKLLGTETGRTAEAAENAADLIVGSKHVLPALSAASAVRPRFLLEIPPLTWQGGPLRLPVAGGGYFRLLPLTLMRWGIEQAARLGHPAMLYFHPWEFDPDQPRLPLGRTARWRTYVGIDQTRARLGALLGMYPCIAVEDWLRTAEPRKWPTYQLEAVSAPAPGSSAA